MNYYKHKTKQNKKPWEMVNISSYNDITQDWNNNLNLLGLISRTNIWMWTQGLPVSHFSDFPNRLSMFTAL